MIALKQDFYKENFNLKYFWKNKNMDWAFDFFHLSISNIYPVFHWEISDRHNYY